MKNKKADMFFDISFLAVMIFVLVVLVVTVHTKTAKLTRDVGQLPKDIIDTYHEAEKNLFIIDQSAKYSAQQAIFDLGQQGGHAEPPNCGNYFGYTIWNDDFEHTGEKCYPDIAKELSDSIITNLDLYLINYPDIPQTNYNFLITEENQKTTVNGFALQPLTLDIKERKKEIPNVDISSQTRAPSQGVVTTPTTTVSSNYVGRLDSRSRPRSAVVDRIILHHTGDSSAAQTFRALRNRGLSVHYIVDRDGTIHNPVTEDKMAYHAKGWNARSIGIEIVNTGKADMQYTNAQYNSIKDLINDIAVRWPSIKADNQHVLGHYQVTTAAIGKWDPSPNIDWSRISLTGHILLADLGKIPPREEGYT